MFANEITRRRLGRILTLILVMNLLCCSTSPVQSKATEKQDSHLSISTSPKVSLTDLRDLGLIVQQIEQQSINIYMEATRKPVKISDQPKIEDLKFITNSEIDTNTKYLKPRPEWLTFYVGTMEPIIHLFTVNARMNDRDVDYLLVPKSIEQEFTILLDEYTKYVNQLNRDVTIIFDNISTENNNIPVAKAAVSLYKTAKNLEQARLSAFNLLKKAKDTNNLVKIRSKLKID